MKKFLFEVSNGNTSKNGAEYGYYISETVDKGYVMLSSSYSIDGDVTGNHGDYDYWIAKLSRDSTLGLQSNVTNTTTEATVKTLSLHVYPNPASDYIIIEHPTSIKPAEIKLIDMSGNLIKTTAVNNDAKQTKIDIKTLANGNYKLVWTNGKAIQSQTILVAR